MAISQTEKENAQPCSLTRWQRAAPCLTLLALSPIVVNVLCGSIRISAILAVLPAATEWGLGTLIIRELVRRRNLGWAAILLLGVALAIAEECVFLQTSLSPLIGVDPNHGYCRAFGVNRPYLLWAIGYETVWAVALPILFVQWLYSDRRKVPWMSGATLAIAIVLFIVVGGFRWYAWTQLFVPQAFPAWAHRPSPITIAIAMAAVGSLVGMALSTPKVETPGRVATGNAPQPWLVGIAALVIGLAWSVLLFLAYGAAPSLPMIAPLVAGCGLAAGVICVVNRWVHRSDWQEFHSLMLASGALLASMSAGFLVLKGGSAPPSDFIGKALLNVLAIVGLIGLGMRFRHKSAGERRAAIEATSAPTP
jgi:hypothetical protein